MHLTPIYLSKCQINFPRWKLNSINMKYYRSSRNNKHFNFLASAFQDQVMCSYTLSFKYSRYKRGSKEKCGVSAQTLQNNKFPRLSLVLNWHIETDSLCSANFLQKPKETASRLHDENWRRSQGGGECLQCFTVLRLCLLSVVSVLGLPGEARMFKAYISHYAAAALWGHERHRLLKTLVYFTRSFFTAGYFYMWKYLNLFCNWVTVIQKS